MVAYLTWGVYGGPDYDNEVSGDYSTNTSILFTGRSSWYLMQSIESFNGWRITSQGNFIRWFSYNAFGGSAYANTPVGAITHVEEPGNQVDDSSIYFGLWAAGKYFSVCAWNARVDPAFQAIGDPLLAR